MVSRDRAAHAADRAKKETEREAFRVQGAAKSAKVIADRAAAKPAQIEAAKARWAEEARRKAEGKARHDAAMANNKRRKRG